MAEVLGLVASIIGVLQLTGALVSVGYDYIGGVKSASKDLQDLVDELHSLGKVLIILQEHADSNPKSAALQKLNSSDGPLKGCTDQLDKLKLKLEAGKALGFKGKVKNLVWPLKEKETMQYISRIERHKSIFTFALTADQMTLSKAIEEYAQNTNLIVHNLQTETAILSQEVEKYAQLTSLAVKKIGEHIQDANIALQDLRNESLAQESWRESQDLIEARQKREWVLEWLYSKPFDKRHLDISARRQKDTGGWLLKSPKFRTWEKGENGSRLLWGYGIPGAGKTFLSSLVIDYFEARAQAENYGVSHIYFDYTEQDEQTALNVLSSLLHQLVRQIPQLPKDIEAMYDRYKKPTVDELYSAIIELADSFSRVFFIFDALDECNQEKQREELLPILHRMGEDGINVFLTSRPHPEDIQDYLSDCTKIELSANEQDIQSYIEERINRNPRAKRLVQRGNFKDRVISGLIDSAQGMFLLVHFQIEAICHKTTPRQILQELDNLKHSPTGERLLGRTYDRAMENLRKQPESYELALKVLSWLIKSGRTLTLDELRVAVSVEPDRYELDELDLPDPVTMLDVCGGLVMINEETNSIRLAHYTVQEYLVQNVIIPDAEFTLARTCITYLLFDELAEGCCLSSSSFRSRLKSLPFLRYVVEQLPFHLNACDQDLTTDLVLRFLGNIGSFSSYSQTSEIFRGRSSHGWHWNVAYYYAESILHLASSMGHLPAVRKLLETATADDISAQDGSGVTPLHKAARKGHEPVARALLEKGADYSLQTNWLRTPLHEAAYLGNEATVRLLVKKGADISILDTLNQTPLILAASRRDDSEAIARFLLEKGADHSVKDEKGQTALHWAARVGNEAVVKLLIEKGADIAAQTKKGMTTLSVAALYRRDEVARILLENGADHSIPDEEGETPLHHAKNEAVVKLLLENGADVSTQSKSGETALFPAVRYGNGEAVRLLLEKGANPSTPDESGKTALHHAVQGYEGVEITRALLEKGANISAQSKTGETVLSAAASYGDNVVVRLLLEKGADLSVSDENGETPLHRAAQAYGRTEAVKTLLERGANISAQSKTGETALFFAVAGRSEAVVQLLLEKGADHSIPNEKGETPLHRVVNEKIAKMLLEKGASISAVSNDGKTALHTAADRGDHSIVQVLLEKGAKHSDLDSAGKTPLDYAIARLPDGDPWKIYDKVIELLRGEGAVSTIENCGESVQGTEGLKNTSKRDDTS